MPYWARNIFPLAGWPVAFVIIASQLFASYIVNLLSYKTLSRIYPMLKARKFEKNGEIYETVFHIKSWKDYIPAIGSFDKKRITKAKLTKEYVSQYLLESLRAELCHIIAIFLSLIVLIVTVPSLSLLIVGYTALLNLPCIFIQRFNRPRFEKILIRENKEGQMVFHPFWIKEGGISLSGRQERKERHEKRRS